MKFQVKVYTKSGICENLSLIAIRSRAFVEICTVESVQSRAYVKMFKFKTIPRRHL